VRTEKILESLLTSRKKHGIAKLEIVQKKARLAVALTHQDIDNDSFPDGVKHGRVLPSVRYNDRQVRPRHAAVGRASGAYVAISRTLDPGGQAAVACGAAALGEREENAVCVDDGRDSNARVHCAVFCTLSSPKHRG
jgi:hypothetical protein